MTDDSERADASPDGANGDADPAATGGATDSSLAATIGFVLAGLAFAVAFLDWTPAVAMVGIPSLPGALTAGLALGVMLLRRHGTLDRPASVIAIVGFVGVMASAAAALLLPGVMGSEPPTPGVAVYAALAIGVVGTGIAYADSIGMGRKAVLDRIRDGLTATGIGVGGLLVGQLVAIVVVSLLITVLTETTRFYVQTTAFSLGLGGLAVMYATRRPEGLGFLDVSMPDRRGWLYVAGGTIAMLVLLVAGALASLALDLPTAEHGLLVAARANPVLLLFFIPIGYLFIGPSEELLNRNVVQKHLYDAYSRHGAILVATLVFSVIHIPAYAGTATPAGLLVTLVRLFLVSAVLGIVYERTDNVVVAAVVHGNFDAIQFGAQYLFLTGVI